MLNIGRLAAGGEGYYLSAVASGVEDYYTGSGDAPGYWMGSAAAELGLVGQVEPDALRSVLAAVAPASGESLGRSSRRRPGFDLTFRAPKSVGVLYALGDERVAREARDAHDAAVAAALGYLEAEAAWSRRGAQGRERVTVSGFAAAAFRHRTSRAGDPLLHTHVVVANLGRAVDDGRWRTLDARALYVHAKTAGYLYQAHLRFELTRRLGVAWQPVERGSADIEGVSAEVVRSFSRRRAQIEHRLAERGESSARAAQAATLETRRAKDHGVVPAVITAEWQVRAAALGFDAAAIESVLDRRRPSALNTAVARAVASDLGGPEGLTKHASTFSRRDVIRAWCDRLGDGGPVDQVMALADGFLADADHVTRLMPDGDIDGDVIRRADGRTVRAAVADARYSTPELLALEARAIAAAMDRRGARAAVIDDAAVEAAVAGRPSLADEQASMVRRITTSGAGVDVVVGKAGAGKTFALDAAREAWQQDGYRVIGTALAARAAAELQAGAGIPSTTLTRLLADLDRDDARFGLTPRTVVVVDEAGMVGTRMLARLLDHAGQAGAKVLLVGDPQQLPEIEAGGLFRGLVNRLDSVALVDNRRQRQEWERSALDQLRDGDVADAVAAYHQRGRIVTADSAEVLRERLVDDWWASRQEDPEVAGLMIAARRSDAADLNDRARRRLTHAGRLTGPELEAAGRRFQAGDDVLFARNDRRMGVVNGQRGVVAGVSADSLVVDIGAQRVTVQREYLDAGHLHHGYAITAHKAQGVTVDTTWVLGSDVMYREWGYVALSRGRHHNALYIVDSNGLGIDTLQDVSGTLSRSGAQHLALDQGAVGPSTAAIRQDPAAARRWRQLEQLRQRAQEGRQQLEAAEIRALAAKEHLHALQSGLGRVSRRREIQRARHDAAHTQTAASMWRDHVRRLEAEIDGDCPDFG